MRVIFRPLINKVPLIGGMSIFFLNNPVSGGCTLSLKTMLLAGTFRVEGIDLLRCVLLLWGGVWGYMYNLFLFAMLCVCSGVCMQGMCVWCVCVCVCVVCICCLCVCVCMCSMHLLCVCLCVCVVCICCVYVCVWVCVVCICCVCVYLTLGTLPLHSIVCCYSVVHCNNIWSFSNL